MTSFLVIFSNIVIVGVLGYLTEGMFLRLAAWVLFGLTVIVVAAGAGGSIAPAEAAISGSAFALTAVFLWFAGHVLHAITRGAWRSTLARVMFQRAYRVVLGVQPARNSMTTGEESRS